MAQEVLALIAGLVILILLACGGGAVFLMRSRSEQQAKVPAAQVSHCLQDFPYMLCTAKTSSKCSLSHLDQPLCYSSRSSNMSLLYSVLLTSFLMSWAWSNPICSSGIRSLQIMLYIASPSVDGTFTKHALIMHNFSFCSWPTESHHCAIDNFESKVHLECLEEEVEA